MDFERLREIIVDTLDCDEDEVKPESSFKDDLGADSIDFVELHMAIEDETGIKIPDEDLVKFQTVQDVLDYAKKNA
jgi:acyl carrier protein